MEADKRRQLEQRSEILKAMAHPSRLQMLEALGKEECCVRTLQELVGVDMSTVSKHLSVLRKAGLVSSDKRGLQVFYALRCPCALDFFDCVEAVVATIDRTAVPVEPEGQ